MIAVRIEDIEGRGDDEPSDRHVPSCSAYVRTARAEVDA